MRSYTIQLDEKDKNLLCQTAKRLDLLPSTFARTLLLRGLRREVARLDNEYAEHPGDQMQMKEV